MDDAASLAFVQEEVQKLRQFTQELSIGSIEIENWDIYVTLVRKKDNRKFTIRLRCDGGYPLIPPSVSFVSVENYKVEGPEFWPDDGEQAFKRNQNPRFICLRGVREYHDRHREIPCSRVDVGLARLVTLLVTMMNK